ncbi:hypothetical protein AOLI_G00263520 [Acnodon oligacanthus]
MEEKTGSSGPPVCIQILSTVALVCFGLYCIVKGVSFGFFNWWYILGAACLLTTAFAAFRVYEVCVVMARSEMAQAEPSVASFSIFKVSDSGTEVDDLGQALQRVTFKDSSKTRPDVDWESDPRLEGQYLGNI